jgi:hypothetical protein
MNIKRSALILALVSLPIMISACAVYVDETARQAAPPPNPHYPLYCNDCHHQPQWGSEVVDCARYVFYFDTKGYWYAPQVGEEVYVFKKYDYKKDKDFKSHYEKKLLKEDQRRLILKKSVKEKPVPPPPSPHYPHHCNDCHHQPHWGSEVVDCDRYMFYFDTKGYWYAPRVGEEVYVFKKYDYKKDKDFKSYYEKRLLKEDQRKLILKKSVKEKPEEKPEKSSQKKRDIKQGD